MYHFFSASIYNIFYILSVFKKIILLKLGQLKLHKIHNREREVPIESSCHFKSSNNELHKKYTYVTVSLPSLCKIYFDVYLSFV